MEDIEKEDGPFTAQLTFNHLEKDRNQFNILSCAALARRCS